MELLTCPACQLRHRPRTDSCCPRCGAIVAPASAAARGPSAPRPPAAPGPGRCQICGRQRPTHYVEFKQNIGALVVRFHKRVQGHLCEECVGQTFRGMSLITFLAGWWGIISFFVTPFILIGNVVQYLGARSAFARPAAGMRAGTLATARPIQPGDAVGEAVGVAAGDAAGDPDAGAAPPSTTLAVTSLVLALLGLLCFGFAGLVPLAAICVGVVALYRVSRSPERYGGRGLALAGVAIGGVGLAVALVSWGLALRSVTNAPTRPGETEFTVASRSIDSYSGQEAFGNTSEAREIAGRFARLMQAVDAVAFERKGTASSPGERHFLTYVELRQDSVCFLVHVPELKSYDGDVRRALLELAWTTAREAMRLARQDRDLKLAVGLRGELLYGALATGMGEGKPTQDLGSVVSVQPLHAFFTGPARSAPPARAAPPLPEAAPATR